MSRGVIGIFCESTEAKSRCSVSVRIEQTRDGLEKIFREEHPNIDVFLDKIFIFECKSDRTNIEVILRKILCQTFGTYNQYKNWDNYIIEDYDKFISFIDNLFQLLNNIVDVREA